MNKHLLRLAALAAGLTIAASGCSLDSASQSSGDVVDVVVGYQSKTINTVTAGTLLRAQGYLERRLADITTRTGTKYNVTWQDYDTGAPITAQMVAEKSAPLGVKTTLSSAHRARIEGEVAAFERLDADMAELFETEDGREGLRSFVERRDATFVGR